MKKIILSAIFFMALVSCQEELLVKGDYPIEPVTKGGEEPSDGKEPAISKWDALKIVEPIKSKYPDRWVDISDKIILPATTIAYNTMGYRVDRDDLSYCKSPEYASWLVVIGKDVSVLGRQRLTHIFINTDTGEYETVELEGRAIIEWDSSRNIYSNSDDKSHFSGTHWYPQRSLNSLTPTKWAVIISGGCNPENNYSSHYNDCVSIYSKLTQDLGFPKNNIFVYISDGYDYTDDKRVQGGYYENSDPDLDGDGTADITAEAKKTRLNNGFSILGLLAAPGDEVVVFMTDHGDEDGCFYLWDGETLSPSELNTLLNKLNPSVKVDVVMGQCYSGSFVSPISAMNRTITTSCSSTETALAQAYNYNYFLHYWTEAILTYLTYGDRYASPYELYYDAMLNTSAVSSQHPQYGSTPVDFGATHHIGGEQIPYIVGSDYLSESSSCTYTIVNYPASGSTTWSPGSYASVISSTDTTALLTGTIVTPGIYYVPDATITANISVNGIAHPITKKLTSVWRAGAYIGYNYITGSNGDYHLVHYPQVGTYPGTYGYQWYSNNPDWQVMNQNGGSAFVYEGPTSNRVDLSVVFNDPFGGTIYISDQVH